MTTIHEDDLAQDGVAAGSAATLGALDARARVWREVDLGALERNYRYLVERLPEPTEVLAVLKADAYGHGATVIAHRLEELGVTMIGVGDSTEALELREAGVSAPILILGAIVPGEMERVVRHGVATCIHSSDRAKLLARVAEAVGRPATVHLKVDTGMGRLGVRPGVALGLARALHVDPNIRFEGLCTHYGSAASPVPYHTSEQISQFVKLLQDLHAEGIRPPHVHASNSAAVFSTLSEHFTMVRVGLALFGINPGNLPLGTPPVDPVLALRTQVVFLKDVPAGTPIGYNRTFLTQRASRVAVLPIGYSDGLPFALSNRADVLVRGEQAPIVGAISMDYTTIDVTDIPGVSVGDEATVIGVSGKRRITVEALARTIGTIPYEIPARLGRRVGLKVVS